MTTNNNYTDNIKLTHTDLEVLEKKVRFFPDNLLNEKVKESKTNIATNMQPVNKPQIINKNRSIKPLNQTRGKSRGIGMRFM